MLAKDSAIAANLAVVRDHCQGAFAQIAFANVEYHLGQQQARIRELEAKLTYGVRNSDPDTSKLAWEYTEKSRQTQRGRLYEVFLARPSRSFTWEEAAELCGLERANSPWKRLGELVTLGKLRVADTRPSKVTGKQLQTYELVPFDTSTDVDTFATITPW